MARMSRGISTVLDVCMKIKKEESCLIVADAPKRDIGIAFFEEAKKRTREAAYMEVPVMERNGAEPPEVIAKSWKDFDVVIMTTSKSFSHTKARKNASLSGTRIATMPGITESMAGRCLDIDYTLLKKRSVKLKTLLDKASTVRMTTKLGTDVSFSVKKMVAFTDYGIYDTASRFGNLPAGESGLAPDEGTTNGTIVVDTCMGTGLLKSPVKITILGGYAVKFEGREAAKVRKQFEGFGKKGFAVAEFAIGLNPKAKPTGIVLEDEKILGTAHMALGNNVSYGGNMDAPVHIDGVMKKPTIWFDKKLIMKDGVLKV